MEVIMDYEKKYKDLIEAVKELQEANPSNEGIQKWVEDNVPQLAKSKDEKIRKYLIILLQHFCKGYRVPGLEFPISFKDMLIWLEKQKPIEDFNGEDYGIDSLWHAITILEKTLGEVEGYQTDDGILEHKCAITAVRKLAKERREQKPVEEVKGISHKWYMCIEGVENFSKGRLYVSNIDDQGTEWVSDDTGHGFLYGHYSRYFRPATEKEIPHKSKFKVRDWITNGELLVGQVSSFDGEYYHYICDGIEQPLHISNAYNWHLWSIADAKDGDVLEFGDHGRLAVGIVSYINKSTGKVDVYCLLEANNFKLGNYYALDTINPHPATKEQREQLEKAMADAGYVWLSGKKELKKIEEKTTCKLSDEHYELEEFAKIVRCNLTGISKPVQKLFEAKYLQLTGNKMYEGFKD